MADFNEYANITLKVNSQEAQEKLNVLDAKAQKLRKEFSEAFKKGDTKAITDINKQLIKTNHEMTLMRSRTSNINAAMKHLSSATPKELRKTLKAINDELNSGAVPRGSAQWKAYQNQIKLVKTEMQKISNETVATQSAFSKFNGFISKWGASLATVIAAITGVSMAVASMKKDMRDKETAQAGLKALTGLDDESIVWLTKQAEKLSTTMDESKLRVTQSSKEILDAYMMVGSNMPELLTDKQALNDVTVETMRLASAASMPLAEAVDAVTTSLNQYSAGAENAANYVNILAAGSKFGASNVQQQAAAIVKAGTAAASADVSMEQLVGTIQMLGEKGIKNEIAGTGLKKFFLTLQTGAKETNPKVVGLSKALENLKTQVDKEEKKSTGAGAGYLKKMFGEEGFNVASILTSNIPKIKEYTKAVTDTNVAVEQAAINSDTSAAKLAQMKNQIGETGILLMEKLNPSFGILVSWSTKLIAVMPTVIDYIQQYGKYVVYAATVVASYIAAQKLQVFWADLVAKQTAKGIVLENLSTIAKMKKIIVEKLQVFWLNATAVAQAAFNVVTALCTLNMTKATQAMKAMNAVLKLNPWAALFTVIVAVAGAIYLLATRTDGLTEAQKQKNSIDQKARENAQEELTNLRMLYDASQDQNKSMRDRKTAVELLQKQYPDYFANLTTEAILAGQAKDAYEDLTLSILNNAKAEARKAQLIENEQEIIRLSDELRKEQKEAFDSAGANATHINDKGGIDLSPSQKIAFKFAANVTEKYMKKINDLKKINKDLSKEVADDTIKKEQQNKTKPEEEKCPTCGEHPCVCKKGITDEEREAIEQKAKEREKAKREAEVKAKKEIADKLTAEKVTYEFDIATNNSEISQGKKTYLKYVEDKHNIEVAYMGRQKKVYEDRNMQESDEYKALLAKELEMKTKHAEDTKRLTIEELEKRQQEEEDALLSQCYDINNKLYNNERAKNEGLHRINVTYLAKKRDTYEAGSKEWIDLQSKIDEAENAEKLRKLKENSDYIAQWRTEYTKVDSNKQKEIELAILDEMYKSGLIKEEEYQKIKKGIVDKYKEAAKDKDGARDPFVDNITQMIDAIKDLSTKGLGLADILKDIGKAAEAGFAIAGAALQQYSQYSQACADLEVAQTEKKYDKLIKNAGKNTKQREKLEEQKEKEINKIKAKASDQAAKIEIAQAIAATALSAIYAFQAGLQVGGPAGLILAPIAAGMAVAAGMIQIATIKKQHAAESAQYYSGGFTSADANNRKEVGIVHANEFVANHRAVANPAVRPILSLIDNAQRNNTIGSLTARDVSNAIGQGAILATSTGAVTNSSSIIDNTNAGLAIVSGAVSSSSDAINRLNKKLDDGIETFMIMDGERGFDRKYKHYQKLQQNAKR